MTFLENKLSKYRRELSPDETARKVAEDIAITNSGDNFYQSWRKNYLSFMRHIGAIDSEGMLTDEGYRLYHLGMSNTPKSKIFHDYFARTVLLRGNHLDLLIDLAETLTRHPDGQQNHILSTMEKEYEARGLIKMNPGRQVSGKSSVGFLKYELILWRSLGLIADKITPNWRRITEICLMPELS